MPVGVDRYILNITNDAIGTSNPAQCHFDCPPASTLTDAERLATMIAWMSGIGECAVNTRIVGATKIASGSGGGVPVPFPVAAYADWVSANAFLVPMSAYGVAYGSASLTTAGSSVTVSQYSTLPGRHGTGRVYRPWLSELSAVGNGTVDPAAAAAIDEGAGACFLGVDGPNWTHVTGKSQILEVFSATAGSHPIAVYKTSAIPARLRSRIR